MNKGNFSLTIIRKRNHFRMGRTLIRSISYVLNVYIFIQVSDLLLSLNTLCHVRFFFICYSLILLNTYYTSLLSTSTLTYTFCSYFRSMLRNIFFRPSTNLSLFQYVIIVRDCVSDERRVRSSFHL